MLIVEDSQATRRYITTCLESASGDLTFIEAANGFEALKILPRHEIALILTDVNMPDINGLEFIRYVRENPKHRKTPVIIISTEGHDRDRERGFRVGADAYLVKPFEPAALVDLVRRFLDAGGGSR